MAICESFYFGYVLDSDEDEAVCQSTRHASADAVNSGVIKLGSEESIDRPSHAVPATVARPVATPLRGRKRSLSSQDRHECIASEAYDCDDVESKATGQGISHPEEGYALRDLRRILTTMLPRYRHLFSDDEHAALAEFSNLSLPAQQLFARLLGRKWPQWISLNGLGDRYRELGEVQIKDAVRELATPCSSVASDSVVPNQAEHLSNSGLFTRDITTDASTRVLAGHQPSWILDSTCESASSLLAQTLDRSGACRPSSGDTFGTLLLEAQPVADLRQFARNLGVMGASHGRKSSKCDLVSTLCTAARRQRMLSHLSDGSAAASSCSAEARLVEQVLQSGRWICVAPSPGRTAICSLTDLFHIETCGVAESSYLVFSTQWPNYSFDADKTAPLFDDRASLDAFLLARRFAARWDRAHEKFTAEQFDTDAKFAEAELRKALGTMKDNRFEAAKFEHAFRRRFTAAWCWADDLHCAIMHAPAVKDEMSRCTKIRQLRLLLDSGLCTSRRGQWYNELAKEVARTEGVQAALNIAAEGVAQGEGKPIAARVIVDLVEASSQEADEESAEKPERFPCIRQDLRWDLARRCRSLAQSAGGTKRGGKKNWQYWLRSTPAAQAKAAGTDDAGRWLPVLVSRLLAEEAAAPGPIRCIPCTCIGLPSADVSKGARRYDSFDLSELSVEELAMAYYFREMSFDCGIHCEGALLRDLFGIVLFSEIFDPSVQGVFMSAYQDAPLDLGTEVFYSTRRLAIEKRLTFFAGLSSAEIVADVNGSFERLYGTRIRGVRWDRYEGPNARLQMALATPEAESTNEECSLSRRALRLRSDDISAESYSLGAVAAAVGGSAIAAALRLLCLEHNSAGLPDLLLWSFVGGRPRARFVEVKSERDSLSRRQRLWLATLRGAGAEAEVCHVRDVPLERASE